MRPPARVCPLRLVTLALSLLVFPIGTLLAAPPSPKISESAKNQVAALMQDKKSRSPAQQKIDSNLLYATRQSLGLPAVAGVAVLRTGVDLESDGRTVVDVSARVTDDLLAQIRKSGGAVLSSNVEY